jgi:hypothetical protein
LYTDENPGKLSPCPPSILFKDESLPPTQLGEVLEGEALLPVRPLRAKGSAAGRVSRRSSERS